MRVFFLEKSRSANFRTICTHLYLPNFPQHDSSVSYSSQSFDLAHHVVAFKFAPRSHAQTPNVFFTRFASLGLGDAVGGGGMMGMPFQGRATLGYDPKREIYESTWIDTMNPHLYVFRGRKNDAGVLELTGEAPISSTAIRAALTNGDVETAARMLGRPFEIRQAM